MRSVYIGDQVQTPDGVGFVEDVITWRDRVLELDEYEAREFSDECRRSHGQYYRAEWVRVVVRFKQGARGYDGKCVTVIKGRDDGR